MVPPTIPLAQPTAAPNADHSLTTVSFSAQQTIQGVTAESLLDNRDALSALKNIIAAAADDVDSTPIVELSSITDASTKPAILVGVQLHAHEQAHLKANFEIVQVAYSVKFIFSSGTVSPEALYKGFTLQLLDSVRTGDFSAALKSSGLSLFANANATTAGMIFGNMTVLVTIAQPTTTSNDDKSLNVGLIIGVTIGSVVLAVAGMLFSYYFRRRSVPRLQLTPIKVVPVNYDVAGDFFDLERFNTPVNAQSSSPNKPSNEKAASSSEKNGKRFDFSEDEWAKARACSNENHSAENQ
jgi:hypothetical protein